MSGCKDCRHMFGRIDGRQCKLNPHDFATSLQRAIVAWLTVRFRDGDNAWDATGCPGFAGRAGVEMVVDDE